MATPEEVLNFWLDEVGPEGWYLGGDELDAQIIEKFEDLWGRAVSGGMGHWLTYPSGALAYLILTDQFPRNMFRNSWKSFATDKYALAEAKQAIHNGWDLKIDTPARQFFYMPLMHSENLCDQERAVRLIKERMPADNTNLLHARAHREVIRRFGRFPYRNEALSRTSTAQEKAFIAAGGYGEAVRWLDAKAA